MTTRHMELTGPLTHVVQVREPSYPVFETIAAFNSRVVAESYAKRGKESNPLWDYRVKQI